MLTNQVILQTEDAMAICCISAETYQHRQSHGIFWEDSPRPQPYRIKRIKIPVLIQDYTKSYSLCQNIVLKDFGYLDIPVKNHPSCQYYDTMLMTPHKI